MSRGAEPPTYDQVAEFCLEILLRGGALPRRPFAADWPAFSRLSHLVHENFEIPSTTFTSVIRHLLYLLASYAEPQAIVGAGTYVGYTLAWLIRLAPDCLPGTAPRSIVGLDVDVAATQLARKNCTVLGHGNRLDLRAEDAVAFLGRRREPIDCLFIDILDPERGKSGYLDVLAAALPNLATGALILAHDPCVEMFAAAFADYHGFVERHPGLRGPFVLPVDACGLSVAVAV